MEADDGAAKGRRERRLREVSRLLAGAGLSLDAIAPSTKRCLDDWARQFTVVRDQPSANHGKVVLDLCRAVESELAATLGRHEDLEFLGVNDALGHKIARLRALDDRVKAKLRVRGVKIGSLNSLTQKLSDLNKLRTRLQVAHGSAELISATESDSKAAERFAQEILKCIRTAEN